MVDPLRSGVGHFSRHKDLAALATVFSFGALLNAFFPRKAVARIVGPGVVGLAFVVALGVLWTLLALPAGQQSVDVPRAVS